MHEEQPRCDRVGPGEPALLGDVTASRLQDRHPAFHFGVGVDPGINGFRAEPEKDAFSPRISAAGSQFRGDRDNGETSPSRMARATPSAATG